MVVLRESTWRHALGTALRIGILTLGACLWWMAGPRGRGGLRRQRPEVHRDRPVDVGHLEPGRHHPGPRLLVLLRHRPPRPLDDGGRPLHPGHLACWPPPTPCPCSPWWRRPSCAGASAPSSSCCSSWGWSSRSGPSRSPTRPAIGGVLKSFMTDTTAGLALRSTDRATPLVLLALFMLLGSGLTALWSRFHVAGLVTALLVAGLVVANNPSLFLGDIDRQQLHPAGVAARLPAGGDQPPQRHPSRHPRLRHPRQRLRRLPLG